MANKNAELFRTSDLSLGELSRVFPDEKYRKVVEYWFASYRDSATLAANTVDISVELDRLDARVGALETAVNNLTARVTTAENNIMANAANIALMQVNLTALTARMTSAEANIITNAAAIAANTTATTDGRFAPQFGFGSPETVVVSNENRTYYDTTAPAAPILYINPISGVNTGWVQSA